MTSLPGKPGGRPLVTVVTPFHNTAEYLAECIESVLRQTYDHWDYVLVDNCSTDQSGAIAREYAAREPRMRIVTNSVLLSQVDNYNFSLRQLTPESVYCKVVQADDWIFPDCLRAMVALAETNSSIGVVSSYRLKGLDVLGRGLPPSRAVVPGPDICREQLLDGYAYFGSPTTLMIRSSIVRQRDPFYAAGRLHEDADVCYDILGDCDFGFVHQILSYSRVDARSATGRVAQFSPALLSRVLLLERHGARFLTPAAHARVLRAAYASFYRSLGASVLRMQGHAYWEFQRRGLATIGRRVNRWRVALASLGVASNLLMNPKRSVERAWGALRERMGRGA